MSSLADHALVNILELTQLPPAVCAERCVVIQLRFRHSKGLRGSAAIRGAEDLRGSLAVARFVYEEDLRRREFWASRASARVITRNHVRWPPGHEVIASRQESRHENILTWWRVRIGATNGLEAGDIGLDEVVVRSPQLRF